MRALDPQRAVRTRWRTQPGGTLTCERSKPPKLLRIRALFHRQSRWMGGFSCPLFSGSIPATGQLPDTAEAEAEQLFANLKAILRAAGGELGDVVRVGIFTTHLQRDRPALNEVWKRAFGDHRPARSAVEATAFGRPGENARFMVEVTARIRDASGGTAPE